MKPYSFMLLLFCIGCWTACAQITLTMTDDRPILEAPSCTAHTAVNVAGTAITLGGPGAGKTFDLTGYAFQPNEDNGYNARPGTAAAPFGAATHVSHRVVGNYPTWFYIDMYYTLDQTGRYYLGKHCEWPDPGINENHVWTPAAVDYPFPCTLGSQWSDDVVSDIFDVPSGQKRGSARYWRTAVVQAAGLLKIPMGEFECLRILRKERTEFGRSSYHEFITKANVRVLVAIDTLDEDSDTPRMKGIIIREYKTSTDAGGGAGMPEGFAVQPNYPNPFTASTRIRYTLTHPAEIRLGVHDVLGREAAVIESGFRRAGTHDVVWHGTDRTGNRLPAGAYFIRLSTSGTSAIPLSVSHRMMLVR